VEHGDVNADANPSAWRSRGPFVVLLMPEGDTPILHCGHGHHTMRTAERCLQRWVRRIMGWAEGPGLARWRIAVQVAP
jgi:hypothetical protein